MHSVTLSGEIVIPPIPGAKDRRRHPRHLCDAPATVVRPEMLFRGTIRNISEGGCYFETHAHLSLEPATEVDLRFKLNEKRFKTPARVRNMIPGRGIGLEFAFSDTKHSESIRNLIKALHAAGLAKVL